jgi:hypothetical protein
MATRQNQTFEKKFKPIFANEDREPIAPHDLPDGAVEDRERYLWTLIDPMVPSGMQYWIPGYHYVNREGYIFTENPWNADDLQDEYRRW